MMGYANGLGFGLSGALWMLGCVLLVVGIVALVAWAIARATTHGAGAPAAVQSTEAHDILRARFARGEMSEAEFVQASNALRSQR
jgi:uncharacterized membrane protein